jgi:hypothetical protein
MTSPWMEEQLHSVLSLYPDASLQEGCDDTGIVVLEMDPIPDRMDLGKIIVDLDADRPVAVGIKGHIIHDDGLCSASLSEHASEFSDLRIARRFYCVEVQLLRNRQGEVGSIHPRVRVKQPEISLRTFPGHPHMAGSTRACVLSPHDNDWSWEHGGLVGILDQTAIWILKSEIWFWSGWPAHRNHRWLGSASPHSKEFLFAKTNPQGPCHCGSGDAYKNCHQPLDGAT